MYVVVCLFNSYLILDRPKFLSALKNYTVKELTSDVTFTCAVTAKPQISVNYRWFFNGEETSHTESTYVVKIARKENSGKYMCQASNSVGPTNSTVGELLVTCKFFLVYILDIVLFSLEIFCLVLCFKMVSFHSVFSLLPPTGHYNISYISYT